MTTTAIQKKIYQAIKNIDDLEFLKNIHELVFDKASRGSVEINNEEWNEIDSRSQRSKKNLKNLKSWKTVKKNVLASK